MRAAEGREACEKFADYPRLRYATKEQLANYEADEYGLHWEDIDEGNMGTGQFLFHLAKENILFNST